MTFQAQAVAAYGEAQAHICTDRSTEYEAIARVTRELASSQRNKETNFSNFVQSLHANRKLWILLASSVADKENGLNPELRSRIFYLAEFSQQHTQKVLKGEADADILIEINTGILRGLGTKGGLS